MVLWDDVGGRTWIERAGPRTEIAVADGRLRRRGRLRRLRGCRNTGPGPRGVVTPERPR
jgi:hypothetical protein